MELDTLNYNVENLSDFLREYENKMEWLREILDHGILTDSENRSRV